MSVSLKLDKDNNLVFGDNFITVQDKESLAQDIKTALGMTMGEYPYDRNQGIDYLSFFRNRDKQALLAAILEKILSDYRVETCDIETSITGKGLQLNLTTAMSEYNEEVKIELD